MPDIGPPNTWNVDPVTGQISLNLGTFLIIVGNVDLFFSSSPESDLAIIDTPFSLARGCVCTPHTSYPHFIIVNREFLLPTQIEVIGRTHDGVAIGPGTEICHYVAWGDP